MSIPKAESVDEYRATVAPAARARFEELYAAVKAVLPEAAEVIKWGTPAFEGRRIYVSIAAFKDHLNLAPTAATMSEFLTELDAAGLVHTKAFVQFPLDVPLPLDLVGRIVAHRKYDVEVHDAKFGG